MKVIPAVEQGIVPVELEALMRDGRLLVRKEAAAYLQWRAVRDDRKGDLVQLREALHVTGCVGLLPLNDEYMLAVRPKVPAAVTAMLRSLGRIDDVARASAVLRTYTATASTSDEMLDRLVTEFIHAVEEVAHEGLYRTYERKVEESSHPRGRLDVGATMRLAASGRSYLARSSYFERSMQNGPNECLAAALRWCAGWVERYDPHATDGTERVHRKVIGTRERAARERNRRLASLRQLWSTIDVDAGRRYLRDPQVLARVPMPGNRQAYVRALPLAVALLTRQGFSLESENGDLAFRSLLIDTNELFEAFIRTRLATELAAQGLDVRNGNALDVDIPLYAAAGMEDLPGRLRDSDTVGLMARPNAPIQPDILIDAPDGRSLLVMDAKNKVVSGPASTDDVRQLITYAVNRGVKRVISVHPMSLEEQATGGPRLLAVGRIGDITVFQYKLPLGHADLDVETSRMASVVAELASG